MFYKRESHLRVLRRADLSGTGLRGVRAEDADHGQHQQQMGNDQDPGAHIFKSQKY